MSSHLTWFTGQRDPSITETITAGGTAVDLTGKTVKFKMRPVGSSTLTVDAAATVVSAAAGTVRYDWQAADVDTPGTFLCWWEVTTTATGKTQDMNEAVIEIRDHASLTNTYVELEEFKSSVELTGKTLADADIQVALVAASRGIDKALGRRFYPDTDANQVRYYTPNGARLWIDDLVTLTSLKTDDTGDGTFENTWTANTDFVLGPLNAAADGEPYTHIEINPAGSFRWPTAYYPRSIEITGKFGWPAVPANVKTLTTMVAHRLVKRARQTPFGGAVGLDLGDAIVRATGYARDPDYAFLTHGLDRNVPIA